MLKIRPFLVLIHRQDRIPIQLRPQFAQLKNLSAVFGPLESLKPPKMQSGNTGGNGRHAALAIITYFNVLNGEPCLSLLIYTKASVSGDEPLDILSYQVENTDFPHQGTQDQFFNEAQWESHRKLGEHIGKPVAQVVQTLIQGVLS